MESNGWVFYHRINLPSQDWAKSLRALDRAVAAARGASRAWPRREVSERTSLELIGDLFEPSADLRSGIARAAAAEAVLAVRWDLSQSGTDDASEPEFMKIRSFQITARRGAGVMLYASHPNEADVIAMLASTRPAAEQALARASGWRRLAVLNKVVSHPVVSGLVTTGLIALIVTFAKR